MLNKWAHELMFAPTKIYTWRSDISNSPAKLSLPSTSDVCSVFALCLKSLSLLLCDKHMNSKKQSPICSREKSGCFHGALRETVWTCCCYYSCSLIDSLQPPRCLSYSSLSLLLYFPPCSSSYFSSSSLHRLQTQRVSVAPPLPPTQKKKKGKRCVPPVLRSPRPDPHTIHSSGLNNASAATDLKGSQEHFSTRNNTSLTVTMETNDGPGWLGGGGLEEGGEKRGDGEGGES